MIMRKRLFILIGMAVAAALVWAGARMLARAPSGQKPAGMAHEHGEEEILYQCSMHPQIVRDRPGKCPICAMDLQPVKRSELRKEAAPTAPGEAPERGPVQEIGRAEVEITLYRQQLIGVRTAEVSERPLLREIRTVGRIAFDPRLYQTQTEYLQVVKALRTEESGRSESAARRARALVEAAHTRLRLLGLSDAEIRELGRAAGADESLLITEGAGRAWVYAEVYEQDLALVRPGMGARITVPTLPGKRFEGEVRAVDPTVAADTRSARARIAVTGEAAGLKPGTYVNVLFQIPLGTRLAAPRGAALDTGARQIVFVVHDRERFEPRVVRLGHSAGEWVEVLEGLEAGERVVTSGNFLVDSESQLRAAAQAMTFYGGREAAEGREPKEKPSAGHVH